MSINSEAVPKYPHKVGSSWRTRVCYRCHSTSPLRHPCLESSTGQPQREADGKRNSKAVCTPSHPRCRMTARETAACKRKSCHDISPTQLERRRHGNTDGGARRLQASDTSRSASHPPFSAGKGEMQRTRRQPSVVLQQSQEAAGIWLSWLAGSWCSEGPRSHRRRSEISFLTPELIF